MESEKKKKIRNNIIFGVFNQALIFLIGLVLPRLILTSYGSEINGLLSTVTQIFSYVALLEAGIGNAAVNALYKPFTSNDEYGVSGVFSATQKYYRKVTLIYAVCVVLISVIYPLFLRTELPYWQIALVIGFQGLSGAMTFFYVAAYKQVLLANGENYIVSSISLLIYVLSSLAKILLMYNGFNIVILQAVYCIVHCAQILMFTFVTKLKYPWLKQHKNPDMSVLSQRSAFMIHEFSSTVFSSTDAFVLSTFCNLMITSVYSVYNMVFVALNSLINSVNNGLNFILGHSYVKNDGKYETIHDAYDSLYIAIVFALFSVAYILICPFIKIYTAGITDIEYVDYKLPILFVIIQLLSCGRATSARLITIAGHARLTQLRSVLEAAINLIVSIVLVNVIGIYGVLIGTIVALLYRANDIIIYANRKILNRSPRKTYLKLFSNYLIFGIIVLAELIFRTELAAFCSSYITFVFLGFILSLFSLILYLVVAVLINHSLRNILIKMFTNK